MDTGTLDNWVSSAIGPPVVAGSAATVDLDRWVTTAISSPMLAKAGGTPLNLADDSFQNASPFDPAESIGTIGTATGGTPPYAYSILSQTLL